MSQKTVKYIVDADRLAGGSTYEKPPDDLIGKRVTIWRPLIRWHGYHTEYKGERYLFAHCELYDTGDEKTDCKCHDCQGIRAKKAEA